MSNWTPEQEAIFDDFTDGSGHTGVDAKAGTGKTTTLVEGIRRVATKNPGMSVLGCAFNKKNQLDLEKKLAGSGAIAVTMNGLGHRAWAKSLGASKRLTLEKAKVGNIVSDLVKRFDRQDLWGPTRQMISMAKTVGLVPSISPTPVRQMVPDTDVEWYNIADHFDIDCNDQVIEMARLGLKENITQAYHGLIDFDDQIYMPVVYGGNFERYDRVIPDEAQDLNPLQHIMVTQSLRMSGRMTFVGDPRQSIYGFRGAMQNSMGELSNQLKAKTLSLSVCWRCSKNVIKHAQQIVPGIQASPTAPDGVVDELAKWDHTVFQTGDAILCRNNAPMIGLAFKLIRHGRGVYVLGRDIGQSLKNLVKKLLHDNYGESIETLLKELGRWEYQEVMNARAKNDDDQVNKIQDKAESLRAVINFGRCETVPKVLSAIDTLFSRESAPIAMGSIHRSKGLEFKRVFCLDPDLIMGRNPQGWHLEQALNLDYVMRTRAMLDLYYINSDGWSDQDEN